jgi:type IV pilus assembly protein PilM
MFRLTRSQVLPIGVDLGSDSVKMLQLEAVDGGLSVVAAARQAMPEDARTAGPDRRLAAAADLVRQMLRQGGFVGRQVVLALPREMVHVKNLRMPPIPAAELSAAVDFEARNVFSFDTTAARIGYLSAGEVRQGSESRQEVIVLAATNEDLDGLVERFHNSGAIVASLDVEACALYRGIERFIRRREDEQDVHVLVDIGVRQTLVVIGRGRDVSFVKTIDKGGEQLHEAVARKLGLSADEARTLRRRLAETPDAPGTRDPVRQAVFDATRGVVEDLGREIALCLRYYSVTFRGSRPSRMRLVGGEACDPVVVALLNAAVPMSVEAGRPLHSVNISRMKPTDRRGNLSEWAVALGLALRTTTQRFGARDGRPREAGDPRPDLAMTGATPSTAVVDFEKVIAAAAAAPDLVTTPLGKGGPIGA